MGEIKLSYILTTYNKLPYLKMVVDLLLQNVQEDEEIVIADGGSTDGTLEFLNELHNLGKIDQFISEKDRGEAHGYNKALLMAKGALIKTITDDDVFDYGAIRSCREFMEKNPAIDLMTGMAAVVYAGTISPINPNPEFFEEFQKWKNDQSDRFYSNGLALLLRRSSLPLLGLFNNDYTYIDAEYTLRSSKWANVAFCNKCIAVRVTNLQSKAVVNLHGRDEMARLFSFYNSPIPNSWRKRKKEKRKTSLEIKIRLSKIKKSLQGLPAFVPVKESPMKVLNSIEMTEFYRYYTVELIKFNENLKIEFYHK